MVEVLSGPKVTVLPEEGSRERVYRPYKRENLTAILAQLKSVASRTLAEREALGCDTDALDDPKVVQMYREHFGLGKRYIMPCSRERFD